MNIHLYKKAMEELVVSHELIHDTANKMRRVRHNKRRLILRYAIVSCVLIVFLGALLLSRNELNTANTPSNPEGQWAAFDHEKNQDKETVPEHHIAFPQINEHHVPFHASHDHSTKLKSPRMPLSYDELKLKSEMIILGTVHETGIYSQKEEPFNPELSLNLATNIYTVEIDTILSGDLAESVGSLIAVGEVTIAHPKSNIDARDELEWSFTPYTLRPEAAHTIEAGKQYVLFLSEKDQTAVYGLAWDGFGVFSVDDMKKEASKTSLSELENQYKTIREDKQATMDHHLLHRLYSLYVIDEFLSS